jgi:hypothetical protein
MFIRAKKVGKNQYGYLVKNTWTKKGPRQKTKAYLGAIVPIGPVEHELPSVADTTLDGFFAAALHSLLVAAGFKDGDKGLVRDDICVDISKRTVRRKGKPCVLQMNEGYLCTHTLKELFCFNSRNYATKLQTANKNVGLLLANALVEAGLIVDEETFIELYAKLVPNM